MVGRQSIMRSRGQDRSNSPSGRRTGSRWRRACTRFFASREVDMALLRRILALGRRARVDREIEAELREHLQMCIDDNLAAGMSREKAEREARLRFGSAAATRERVAQEDAAL